MRKWGITLEGNLLESQRWLCWQNVKLYNYAISITGTDKFYMWMSSAFVATLDSFSGGDFSPAHPKCNQCSQLSHWMIILSGMLHLILCRQWTFVGCFNSSMGKGSRHSFLKRCTRSCNSLLSNFILLGIFSCMVSKVYRKSTTILPLSAHVLVKLWFQGIVAIFLFISSICARCSWSEEGNSPPWNLLS